MKNCANYGSVTHSGTTDGYVAIGGIAGWSDSGSMLNHISIQNCLNYGTISHYEITSERAYIGGILGVALGGTTIVEGCVNTGKMSVNKTSNNYIGGIVGIIDTSSSTTITHCYWTSDTTYSKAYSGSYVDYPTIVSSTSFNFTTFELNETVSVGSYTGTSLIDVLNAVADYYHIRDYSHWLLNKDSKEASFTISNRGKPLTLNTQLILLPGLASEGRMWFNGWYTDSSCTVPLTNYEINTDTALYGKWEENNNYYTIIFDTRGGAPVPEPITAQYSTVVELPSNVTRERYGFMWWENDYGDRVSFSFTVPAHNITLHAVWLCTHIKTAEDLIDFSKLVNSGTSCEGFTMFLDNDIDFTGSGLSEQFEPIGNYYYGFQGTFDGQGYIISNLVVNSSSEYTGDCLGTLVEQRSKTLFWTLLAQL